MNKWRWVVGVFVGVIYASLPAFAETAEPELYYAAQREYVENANVELTGTFGYGFSNPLFSTYSANLSVLYLPSQYFAFGIEYARYSTSARQNMDLFAQFVTLGFTVDVIRPEQSLVGVIRVTPLSGLVNLFSWKIMTAGIGLLVRAGAMDFQGMGRGPLLGSGVELHVGFGPTFGFLTSLLWDWQRPPGRAWETQVGFRVGPVVRF